MLHIASATQARGQLAACVARKITEVWPDEPTNATSPTALSAVRGAANYSDNKPNPRLPDDPLDTGASDSAPYEPASYFASIGLHDGDCVEAAFIGDNRDGVAAHR